MLRLTDWGNNWHLQSDWVSVSTAGCVHAAKYLMGWWWLPGSFYGVFRDYSMTKRLRTAACFSLFLLLPFVQITSSCVYKVLSKLVSIRSLGESRPNFGILVWIRSGKNPPLLTSRTFFKKFVIFFRFYIKI